MDTNNPETKSGLTQPQAEELALQDNEAKIRKWGYVTTLQSLKDNRWSNPKPDSLIEVDFRPEPPEDI